MRLLYVKRHEIACKCGCGKDTFDVELSEVLEDIRMRFKQRLIVHSGNRCHEYNELVGGSDESQHILSKATDFSIENVSPKETYAYLVAKYPNKYGIGSYSTFTHVDVRKKKARW